MPTQQAHTILLVESEPVLAEITQFRLELLGYRVLRAATAEEAFAVLEAERPTVILIDMLLPDTNGFDLMDRISNDERTSRIPVMALSSNADLHDVQRAFVCGAEDYLVVPFDPAVLEKKLEKLLTSGA